MTIAPEQPGAMQAAAAVQHAAPPAAERGRLGMAVPPVLLAAACGALYLYVHGRTLDSIERRSLNAPYLTARVLEHIRLTAVSTLLVIVIAVPLGIMLTRPLFRRARPVVLGVVNIGQAVPSIGVLVLLALTIGVGFGKAIIALVLYAFLPVLRNTMVGLQGVDRSLIDAARGMGMTRWLVLWRVELPLAIPVMMAGIRTALIINVGTATLATFTNAHGLGDVIDAGLVLDRRPVLITGAVLVAVLGLAIDWIAGLAERALRPRGV